MLIASHISSVCLPLASGGEAFWVFMALCFALWGIFAAVAKTAEDSQSHAAATDRKRCRHCREEHPGFAAYCRQCGRRF